ncbi:MAG: type II toxin-antitoxin system Phd/YefM family antitoxin, partial [Clostridiales bacterium]|nr:type II toxin-antitoxin system Phd/YefM family antitoxin [Clostridiales bacterium]
ARLVDRNGEVVIFKNNKPKYLITDIDAHADIVLTDDEKIDVAAARILKRYKAAFLELAK